MLNQDNEQSSLSNLAVARRDRDEWIAPVMGNCELPGAGFLQQAVGILIAFMSILSVLSFVVWFHWVLVMRLPGC